jgi:hypothetical protein
VGEPVNEFTPEQEQFITEVVNRVTRRQARVLERVGTDLHALIMALATKRLITMDDFQAARRQLDEAFEVTRARQLYSLIADIESLDDDDRGPDDADRRIA